MILIVCAPVYAQISAPFGVVSSADFRSPPAPDSLATIGGASLARSTASATLDANGQLPTQLAGTQVLVNGQATALLFVSPVQINFVVPAAAAPGTARIEVRNTDTGFDSSTGIALRNASPAVFTSDASGTGPGAILNAVTNRPAPFLVETPENGGGDLRTRIAVYGTGIRYAGNPSHDPLKTNVAGSVQAQGQDAAGNRYNFTVEYAGPAPGFFGLDQVNIVLPPELDGAGVVSLSITAESATSNAVSFQMGRLPDSAIRLTGIAFAQPFVNGGDNLNATLSLNAPARFDGVPVTLRSSNPAAQPPGTATVPTGKTSVQATIATAPVTTAQTATITAQAGNTTQTATLEIDPVNTVQLSSLSVTPSTILGGRSLSATATLTGNAPGGGVTIQVSSDNPAAQPPSAVSVLFGNSSINFPIPTSPVATTQTVNITASAGRASKTVQVSLAGPLQLSLDNSVILGGNPVTGTIILGDGAPGGGAIVTVLSSDLSAARVPSPVTVPGGQISSTFTITTSAVLATRTVTISISYAGNTQSASLRVDPAGVGGVTAVTVFPDHVTGGTNATGTVTLSAPAPFSGVLVSLQSSSPLAVPSPTFLTVPSGSNAATFSIITTRVTAAQTVTISATGGGVTKSAILTVQ